VFGFFKKRAKSALATSAEDRIDPGKTQNVSKARVSGVARKIVQSDLSVLNKMRSGLGNQAADYVLGKGDESVLSTLSNLKGQQGHALLGRSYGYLDKNTPIHRRRTLLSQMKPFDVGLAARYGQILSALSPNNRGRAGSSHCPPALASVVSEIFEGLQKQHGTFNYNGNDAQRFLKPSMIGQDFVALCETLGGSATDMFDLLFEYPSTYYDPAQGYRLKTDMKALALAYPDDFGHALQRIGADGRLRMINRLAEWRLVEREPFATMIFDSLGDGSKKRSIQKPHRPNARFC
jgi:hypothetical protein